MRWFWQSKEAEIEENEAEIKCATRFDAVDMALAEVILIVNRIDQRHYKGRARSNGDSPNLGQDPAEDWAWMRQK